MKSLVGTKTTPAKHPRASLFMQIRYFKAPENKTVPNALNSNIVCTVFLSGDVLIFRCTIIKIDI